MSEWAPFSVPSRILFSVLGLVAGHKTSIRICAEDPGLFLYFLLFSRKSCVGQTHCKDFAKQDLLMDGFKRGLSRQLAERTAAAGVVWWNHSVVLAVWCSHRSGRLAAGWEAPPSPALVCVWLPQRQLSKSVSTGGYFSARGGAVSIFTQRSGRGRAPASSLLI